MFSYSSFALVGFCLLFPFGLTAIFLSCSLRTSALVSLISNIISLYIVFNHIYFLYKSSLPVVCDIVNFFLDSFQRDGFFGGLAALLRHILPYYLAVGFASLVIAPVLLYMYSE